jgi:hypothetical protein
MQNYGDEFCLSLLSLYVLSLQTQSKFVSAEAAIGILMEGSIGTLST